MILFFFLRSQLQYDVVDIILGSLYIFYSQDIYIHVFQPSQSQDLVYLCILQLLLLSFSSSSSFSSFSYLFSFSSFSYLFSFRFYHRLFYHHPLTLLSIVFVLLSFVFVLLSFCAFPLFAFLCPT